jgi:NAD(P)-dependent dehydrogenase (short-subunit alcohol dehydrogenase family)
MRLMSKVAVVTGSSSGLGRVMAARLAEEGAIVVITGRNEERIAGVVSALKGAGKEAIGIAADVTSRVEVRNLMEGVFAAFGRIDILVNNAGITRHRPFQSINDEDWSAVVSTDLKGVFYCIQAAAQYMIDQRYGRIVNISSTAATGVGTHPAGAGGSPAGSSSYIAAKAGVIQLTRTMARELGPYGVNVNCLAPGTLSTEMVSTKRTRQQVEDHRRQKAQSNALRRLGTPREVANAVAFLASDESSFISGQLLCVDGGRIDRM